MSVHKSFKLIYKNRHYDMDTFRQLQHEGEEWLLEVISAIDWYISDEEFYPVMTSGSTSEPKEVRLSREQIKRSCDLTAIYFGLKTDDSALLCLPASYIAGKLMIFRALKIGMSLTIVQPGSNPLKNIDVTDTHFEFTAMTPMQVHNIIESPVTSVKLENFKTIIIGGAPVSESLKDSLQNFKNDLYSTYGMTETVTHIAVKKLNGSERSDLFEALEGVTFSTDSRDCLIIHALHLAEDGIYTNDVVALVDKRSFRWLGRADNVINSGGIKLHPEVIENKLHSIIGNAFYLTSKKHESLGEQLVLVIEDRDKELVKEELHEKIKSFLDAYESPREIYIVDQLHYTETGKIKRDAIK